MNYKPLAQTGVLLPEVGLGTWSYHGGTEPLRAGFDAGALFVDTAESYGSEPIVGQAVAGRREKVFLATKVSPEHFRFDEVRKAADASLQRLRVQHLDLYQLHSPNPAVPIAETLGAMEKLVDDGKVRFIGVSNFSLNQLQTAQAAMRRHRIVANQVRYNIIDRTIEKDLLAYCQANHVTVIAYSPLGREVQRIRDCDPKSVLAEIGRETGKTPPQIILNWCLCKKDVVVIPKGNSISHVVENCGASGWRLDASQLKRLDECIQFRHRGRAELALRRAVSRVAGPTLKRCIKFLPPAMRRWFS